MGPTVVVTVISVLYAISFAAFVISFVRLRSDMHTGFDRLEARFDKIDARFDNLNTRFDNLFDRAENLRR